MIRILPCRLHTPAGGEPNITGGLEKYYVLLAPYFRSRVCIQFLLTPGRDIVCVVGTSAKLKEIRRLLRWSEDGALSGDCVAPESGLP